MTDFTPSSAMVEACRVGTIAERPLAQVLRLAAAYLADPANAVDARAWAKATMEQHGYTDDDIGPHQEEPDCLDWEPKCIPLFRVQETS